MPLPRGFGGLKSERGCASGSPRSESGRRSADASVVLLARDAAGYANLCRLVTDAHMTGSAAIPRSPPSRSARTRAAWSRSWVRPHRRVRSRSPDGSTPRDARSTPIEKPSVLERTSASSTAWSGTRRRRSARSCVWPNERIARLVATNPVRYLVPEDAFLADALECMRELVPVNRSNVSRRNAEGWLKPATEMRALFGERPDLVTATLEIAESCAFDIGLRTVRFPEFPTPSGRHVLRPCRTQLARSRNAGGCGRPLA